MVDELPSVLTRERVRRLAWEFHHPFEVHLLVPREVDRTLAMPVGYCVVYTVQLRAGLCFSLLPLLVKLL